MVPVSVFCIGGLHESLYLRLAVEGPECPCQGSARLVSGHESVEEIRFSRLYPGDKYPVCLFSMPFYIESARSNQRKASLSRRRAIQYCTNTKRPFISSVAFEALPVFGRFAKSLKTKRTSAWFLSGRTITCGHCGIGNRSCGLCF